MNSGNDVNDEAAEKRRAIVAAGRRSIDFADGLRTDNFSTASTVWRDLLSGYPDWMTSVEHGVGLRRVIAEHFIGRQMTEYDTFAALPREAREQLPFVQRYRQVCAGVPESLHISEPPFANEKPWGVEVDGKQLSNNVARYQGYISTLYHQGLLDLPRDSSVIEIGTGSGQFASHFCSLIPCRYVLVDLPQNLYLAAAFCAIALPERRLFVFDPDKHMQVRYSDIRNDYDLFFIPNYMLDLIYGAAPFQLALNFWSLQEMTDTQVVTYLTMLHHCLDGYFYSNNFLHHPKNEELLRPLGEYFRRFLKVSPDREPDADSEWDDRSHLCSSSKRPHDLSHAAERIFFNINGRDQPRSALKP
jgi:putative sugar O-methyltransferase